MLALSFLSLNPRFYKLVGTTYCLLYVRYMDDVLLFADTMQEIKDILHTAKHFLEEESLLTLKEETIGKTGSGVPFLGFLLKPKGIYLA